MTLALALGAPAESPIKSGEVVVFFPTFAHLDKDGNWSLNFNGWTYSPQENSVTQKATLGLLRRSLGLEKEEEDTDHFKQRARAFLVDNHRGKKIPIQLGDKTYVLEASEPNGHFKGTVKLSADEADKLLKAQKSTNGWLEFKAVMPKDDQREFKGKVQLIGAKGLTVISDIDDTIKISEVLNKKALLRNTFLKEYQAVPGMADLYKGWAKEGAVFHYVSASPWQLYEPLAVLQTKSEFPAGTFHLKLFRWKDSTFFQIFAAPEKFKPPVIEPILAAYPQRQFILVGDSGEKDPEIYGELARKHPKQVARIFIRNVTKQTGDNQRYKDAFKDLAKDMWHVYEEPKEIADKLPKGE